MRNKLARKIVCAVVVVLFSINDLCYGLGIQPMTAQPGGQARLAGEYVKRLGYGRNTVVDNYIPHFEGPEFIIDPATGQRSLFMENVRFIESEPNTIPEEWLNASFFQALGEMRGDDGKIDMAKAMKYFMIHEAGLPEDTLEFRHGYYGADEESGVIPVDRIEQVVEQGSVKYACILDTRMTQKWADLLEHDVRYEYTFPDGKKRIVSVAWSIFFRTAKHIMTDLKKADLEKWIITPKVQGMGHFTRGVKNSPHHYASLANIIDGRYWLPNDAAWLWFTQSYCLDDTRRYDNNKFKERLDWFFSSMEARQLGLPQEFPEFLEYAEAREESKELAHFINYHYFSRLDIRAMEPVVDPKSELITQFEARVAARKAAGILERHIYTGGRDENATMDDVDPDIYAVVDAILSDPDIHFLNPSMKVLNHGSIAVIEIRDPLSLEIAGQFVIGKKNALPGAEPAFHIGYGLQGSPVGISRDCANPREFAKIAKDLLAEVKKLSYFAGWAKAARAALKFTTFGQALAQNGTFAPGDDQAAEKVSEAYPALPYMDLDQAIALASGPTAGASGDTPTAGMAGSPNGLTPENPAVGASGAIKYTTLRQSPVPIPSKIKVLFADDPANKETLDVIRKELAWRFGGDVEIIAEHGGGNDKDWLRARIEKYKPNVIIVRSDTKAFKPEGEGADPGIFEFAKANGVKAIIRAGVAYENIDTDKARENGISVARTHGSANSVADLTLFLLAALDKKLGGAKKQGSFTAADIEKVVKTAPDEYLKLITESKKWGPISKEQKQEFINKWKTEIFDPLAGNELEALARVLNGRTIGLLGWGPIAQVVAEKLALLRKLLPGISFTVIAHSRSLTSDNPVARELGVTPVSRQKLFEDSDIVSIHLPAIPGLELVKKELASEKLKAIINTSRSPLVNPKALESFANLRRIMYLGDLDITDELLKLIEQNPENVRILPHIGASTKDGGSGVEENTVAALIEMSELLLGMKSSSENPTLQIVNGVTPKPISTPGVENGEGQSALEESRKEYYFGPAGHGDTTGKGPSDDEVRFIAQGKTPEPDNSRKDIIMRHRLSRMEFFLERIGKTTASFGNPEKESAYWKNIAKKLGLQGLNKAGVEELLSFYDSKVTSGARHANSLLRGALSEWSDGAEALVKPLPKTGLDMRQVIRGVTIGGQRNEDNASARQDRAGIFPWTNIGGQRPILGEASHGDTTGKGPSKGEGDWIGHRPGEKKYPAADENSPGKERRPDVLPGQHQDKSVETPMAFRKYISDMPIDGIVDYLITFMVSNDNVSERLPIAVRVLKERDPQKLIEFIRRLREVMPRVVDKGLPQALEKLSVIIPTVPADDAPIAPARRTTPPAEEILTRDLSPASGNIIVGFELAEAIKIYSQYAPNQLKALAQARGIERPEDDKWGIITQLIERQFSLRPGSIVEIVVYIGGGKQKTH
ncbi:MAG: hypothetical protein NTY34_00370, partial [Candidatus Omnitrophica bacterium]|nr:hypothetical protein [Candidatus Omnitrophota bacterium]